MAMANRPNFDLNLRSEAKPEEMKNRAIIDMMEPGSTFKIVAAAAALNEHKLRPDSTIFCENGLWNFGGAALHDHRAFSYLSVRDVLIKSSNIGAAKLALSVGEQKFYEYIRRFGFGERTGIELPGEINGVIRPPRSWSKISITRIPMGHEIGVTPLQMIVAMAAIANGGKLVMPRIVKSITTADGKAISSLAPVVLRQVTSPETARQIGDALRGAVSDRGTAAAAAVPGFTIAGHTGGASCLNQCFTPLNALGWHVETSCSSKLSSPGFHFAKSSAHLIAQWKASRMTRGGRKGMACSWHCGVEKATATNSLAKPSRKALR